MVIEIIGNLFLFICLHCVSWKSQLQNIVALSTTEFDYIAAAKAIKEVLWFRNLLNELGVFSDNMILYSNSQSAIYFCKNPLFHERTKNIDVKLHFIRDVVSQELIKLEKVHVNYNLADMGIMYSSW